MEKYITDEQNGLEYELVGGLLHRRRRGRAAGKTDWSMGCTASGMSETASAGIVL